MAASALKDAGETDSSPSEHFLRQSHLHAFRTYFEKAPSSHSRECPVAENQPHDISVDTLRGWIAACDASHGGHCHHSRALTEMRGRPLWLIDTLSLCLVPARADLPYVALSYVWGQTESISASRDNIDRLQIPSSLKEERIPRTILDAIRLTGLLGYRYLWVDRLCIVQDDPINKKGQIRNMGGIYAKSVLTMVAARGDSAGTALFDGSLTTHWRDTLPGSRGICVEGGSYPIECPYTHGTDIPCPANMDGTSLLDQLALVREHDRIMHRQMQHLAKSTWSIRGWTFQEYLFSSRRLVFVGSSVNWDCHCASWHENQTHITARPCLQSPSRLTINRAARPDFDRYTRLVALFAGRELTYPQDVLDACESMLLNLSLAFPGGFVSGLPRAFFHEALLWRPWGWSSRRVSKEKEGEVENESPPAALPSWSWAGWQGDVHSEVWTLFVDPPEPAKGSSSSLVKRGLTRAVAISHSFGSGGPWEEINQYGTCSTETGSEERDRYAEALSDEKAATRSRYLRIRTTSASFYLGGPFPVDGHWTFRDSGSKLPKSMVLSLYENMPPDSGKRVGYLAMSVRGSWRDEPSAGVLVSRPPRIRRIDGDVPWFLAAGEVKLIELSRSGRSERGDSETHINVLCVEEGSEPGVLNRVAIGLMSERAWDSRKRTEETVILG